MSVGPRRRDNPIRDWGVRLGIVAGESNGGGVGREQRRQAPASTGAPPPFAGGGGGIDQSATSHTSEAQWTSDPLTVPAGPNRLIVLTVQATGVTPGVVGSLISGNNLLATAPVDGSGQWAQTITWPAGAGGSLTVSVGWPSAESGTLVATLIDPG